MSIKIIDAFVAMRRTLASIGPVLARIETVERRQITDQSRNEARFDAIFEKMSEGEILAHQIFYQNRFWDAKSLLVRIIRRAKKELIVVDAYPGVAMLDILAKRGRAVKIELITHSNGEL
jgi:sugar-specific transcriptional regulator TrmB